MTAATKKFIFCLLQAGAAFYLNYTGHLESDAYKWVSIGVTLIYVAGEIANFELGPLKMQVTQKEPPQG